MSDSPTSRYNIPLHRLSSIHFVILCCVYISPRPTTITIIWSKIKMIRYSSIIIWRWMIRIIWGNSELPIYVTWEGNYQLHHHHMQLTRHWIFAPLCAMAVSVYYLNCVKKNRYRPHSLSQIDCEFYNGQSQT